ncbi:hypothetical protein [Nocardia pseudovaccinii]|uniref:hypothetical protein n=1 Tax=Nocardia pseudovaccinii TaxID=189540 RepID=UPI0012F4F23C|nr:hypothetical protein [Nocardia pseudovaccinii]
MPRRSATAATRAYGAGRTPGSAREALRTELEALLGDRIHRYLLRAELTAMLNGDIRAASKLRERIQAART